MRIQKLKEKNTKSLNFIFILRNKKYVRKNSAEKKKIGINEHEKWLKRFFKNKKNKIYIIKSTKKEIGYIRLQKKRKFFELSWALLNGYKGKKIISKCLKKVTLRKKNYFKAKIKKNNYASIKAAQNAGFRLIKDEKLFVYMLK